MTLRDFFRRQTRWVREGVESGGEEFVSTTRASVFSVEARTGAVVWAVLWGWGRLTGRALPVDVAEGLLDAWGRSHALGAVFAGEILPLGLSLLLGAFWGVMAFHVREFLERFVPLFPRLGFRPRARAVGTVLFVLMAQVAVGARDLVLHPAFYSDMGFSQTGALVSPGVQFVLSLFLLLVGVVVAANVLYRGVVWFLNLAQPVKTALVVSATFGLLSALGAWIVVRLQAEKNSGPNVLLLVVDGLRYDRVMVPARASPAPTLRRLFQRGRGHPRCVPFRDDAESARMSFWSGTSLVRHGLRAPFPSSDDVRLPADGLPSVLRARRWTSVVFADAGGDLYRRWENEFDFVLAPDLSAGGLRLRRSLERHRALRPYMSGRWGRVVFPFLRGAGSLSDPDLLGREAAHWLLSRAAREPFFLTVDFSILRRLSTPVNALAGRLASRGGASRAAVYNAHLVLVDRAVGRLMRALRRSGVDENTQIVVWSPRGTALTPEEETAALDWGGPVFDQAPFFFVEPHVRSGARVWPEPIQVQDVVATLLNEWRWPLTPSMDGTPLFDDRPDDEWPPVYNESTGLDDGLFEFPAIDRMMRPDRDARGRLRLDPAYIDRLGVGKRRRLTWPDRFLEYRPTATGVVFVHRRAPGIPARSAREETGVAKEREELFYQWLAREAGWKPQNNYLVPESFLKERAEGEEDSD